MKKHCLTKPIKIMDRAHTQEEFDMFMSQLRETNANLGFFTDFGKIAANVESVAIKLNQLNYLIGKEELAAAVHRLWDENPKVFEVLNILIAVRTANKKVVGRSGSVRILKDFFTTPEGVIEYVEDTGLYDVLRNKHVTNLVDYVFGVETGLDTNARKNRSGHVMEGLVADILRNEGIDFRQEVYSTEFEDMAVLGEDIKRFDFVVQTPAKSYLIEVNFYSDGGSKLNEVARAYSELAPKINQSGRYGFVWITDGQGWKSARNKLEEAFYSIPCIYNLTTIDEFVRLVKAENGMRQ